VPDSPAYGNSPVRWRVSVSILLIGLVLYNPFHAWKTHSDGLAYSALARHRATVGASEMQHFTPVQADENGQIEKTFDEAVAELLAVRNEYPAKNIQEGVLPLQPELIESICFRPPPSLKHI
jgi:hypothetical protein